MRGRKMFADSKAKNLSCKGKENPGLKINRPTKEWKYPMLAI